MDFEVWVLDWLGAGLVQSWKEACGLALDKKPFFVFVFLFLLVRYEVIMVLMIREFASIYLAQVQVCT